MALAESADAGDTPLVVDTLDGRMHVRWDRGAAATPHGQLFFFDEFLAAAGVFESWVSACPLECRSGNAADKRDVLGTMMLGLLAGYRRYAHITALRGDAVAAQALGMNKVSEDALRRALERIDESASAAWMRPPLMHSVALRGTPWHSVREAFGWPWVLDIAASIKPLYGRQKGAERRYNPRKPGRPSHVLHTFWVGNLRLVWDVQVSSGKQHSSVHAKTALARLLDEPQDRRPALVRGDSRYAKTGTSWPSPFCACNEGILLELESRKQPYLLRLRQTANVQRLVGRQFERQEWSRPDSQGCQVMEDPSSAGQPTAHGRRRCISRRCTVRSACSNRSSPTSVRPCSTSRMLRSSSRQRTGGRCCCATSATRLHRLSGGSSPQNALPATG